MKKYFKKFGIMFVMALILSLGFCISAFADDNGVVGTANLNGTAQNSAIIGSKLMAPEIGWERYDDNNKNISYTSGFISGNNSSCYKTTDHQVYNNSKPEYARFNFIGTKIRLISILNSSYPNYGYIKIDGKEYNFNIKSNLTYQVMLFQETDLTNQEHVVEIYQKDNSSIGLVIDAIDIDDDGQLLPYNESISLDKSSMDLNVGDSQQLTATTTPAGAQVTWTTSDSSIATVDSNGSVTAVSEGQATITATIADGSNVSASCAINVTPKDTTTPTEPTGDANLYIELVDGQIKQYTVSSDEINKFTEWYENRDNDHSLPATYKFTKGSYTDYVVQSQIDWFEVR